MDVVVCIVIGLCLTEILDASLLLKDGPKILRYAQLPLPEFDVLTKLVLQRSSVNTDGKVNPSKYVAGGGREGGEGGEGEPHFSLFRKKLFQCSFYLTWPFHRNIEFNKKGYPMFCESKGRGERCFLGPQRLTPFSSLRTTPRCISFVYLILPRSESNQF